MAHGWVGVGGAVWMAGASSEPAIDCTALSKCIAARRSWHMLAAFVMEGSLKGDVMRSLDVLSVSLGRH